MKVENRCKTNLLGERVDMFNIYIKRTQHANIEKNIAQDKWPIQ